MNKETGTIIIKYGGQEFCEIDAHPVSDDILYKDLYTIQTSTGSWLVLCEISRIVDPPNRRGEIIRTPIKRGDLETVILN